MKNIKTKYGTPVQRLEVRMPEQLMQLLRRSAKVEGTSVNQQVTDCVRERYQG